MVGGRVCSATVCFRPHQLPQPPGAAYPTKQHLISTPLLLGTERGETQPKLKLHR